MSLKIINSYLIFNKLSSLESTVQICEFLLQDRSLRLQLGSLLGERGLPLGREPLLLQLSIHLGQLGCVELGLALVDLHEFVQSGLAGLLAQQVGLALDLAHLFVQTVAELLLLGLVCTLQAFDVGVSYLELVRVDLDLLSGHSLELQA